MSISSCKAKLVAIFATKNITLNEIGDSIIDEQGYFLYYAGAKRIAVGRLEREFVILVSEYAQKTTEDRVDAVEAVLLEISLAPEEIGHTATSQLYITDDGLFMYRVSLKVIDEG